jgi:transposase-like protein
LPKKQTVQEVATGASISEVRRRYGLPGTATVQRWIRRFGREELLNKVIRIEMKGEHDRLQALEKELKATKIALAEKTMALDAMETAVSLANRHYGTDLKKISERSHRRSERDERT